LNSNKKNFSFIFAGTQGERLDVFLCEQTSLTRSNVQKSIKKKLVFVNDKVCTKTGFALASGNLVKGEIELSPDLQSDLKPEDIELKIIYEDEQVAVIDKTAGLVVHPAGPLREGTLVNALLHKYKADLSNLNKSFRPGIVHRLDKDTSGLMVIAKTNEAHLHLAKQLSERTLKRIYWAIAVGNFKTDVGTIEAPLGRHPVDRKKMAVVKNETKKARHAKTFWQLIQELKNAALLEVSLQTGRTHQIRVHFEYINHPLLGDPVYGGKLTQSKLISRQCLHAKKIAFVHPTNNQIIELESELPDDFKLVLEKLKK
jgi:23S rRNA pseudouridine1911/1915/1917 synthase